MVTRSSGLQRAPRLVGVLAAFFVLLLAGHAFAVGTVKTSERVLEETESERWVLKLEINLGSPPHVAYVPMTFEFQQTVLYERTLTDDSPDKPVLNKIPLQNQQAVNESMDVGFSDPSGKIFPLTKFSFKIRRDRGFEAGEYTLKIKRASDNAPIGQPIKLVLNGENKVVDRRAMNFVASSKKKKEDGDDNSAPAAPGGEDGEDDYDQDAEDDAWLAQAEADQADGPPKNPPKQGGCGCRAAGSEDSEFGSWSAFGLLLAAGAVITARRRCRRPGAPLSIRR